MPDTVVTRPSFGRIVAQPASQSDASDCRTKWLNGPPAKAMPPVSVGVPEGVEPELALLDPHRGREARVHLGEAELVQRSTDVVLGGTAEHRHGRPGLRGVAGRSA